MSYPEISVSCVAAVYVRQMHFKKAGDVETGHAHCFDHQTLVSKGSVQIEVEGKKTIFKAPHIVFIRKDIVHELTALEDDTVVYCIHALRDGPDVCDIIDPASIPLGAKGEEAFVVAKSLTHTNESIKTPHLGG
ncbi:hypothetical protein EB118_07380 [bacterium]|nr:hypothetical protein [bacterium]